MHHRIGLGFDSHRIEPGGPMKLGGVAIDCEYHLHGHSDADALLHSITDAILSASGQEDIGQLFPNSDPQWSGADSTIFLKEAIDRARAAGFSIENIDSVVRSEVPNISRWKSVIQARLSELLGISIDRIGLKGKSGEKTGDIGRGVILEVQSVVLLAKSEN